MKVRPVLDVQALLGEGPVWLPRSENRSGVLFWLDIEGHRLHCFDPAGRGDKEFEVPNKVGCLAPCENGHFLLASQTGIEEVRIESDRIRFLRCLAHPESNQPGNRYNDGKCSPEGRFWFGSLNQERQSGRASLYVLDDRGCRSVLTGATNSNGLGWSPDGATFYWIDTPTRRIEAFAYDQRTGALSNRRTVVAFPDDLSTGRPDGMTVDAEGMIWVAHWLGGRVSRWNPSTGNMLCEIFLPVSRVTSVTFGGDRLETLYITTACKEMTPEERRAEPLAGGLFAVEMTTKASGGGKGLPVALFKFG